LHREIKKTMDWIHDLFYEAGHLNSIQMGIRAILVMIGALLIFRISGQRTFGMHTAIDNIVMIILGGILGRVITGGAPFLPGMFATLVIVLLHRLLAWICLYNHDIGNIIKGRKLSLYKNGVLNTKTRKQALLSDADFMEGIRLATGSESLEGVDEVFIERNGRISVVKKQPPAKEDIAFTNKTTE
jgi:uncharacterized membrane protein YcaP (DUF421 family)